MHFLSTTAKKRLQVLAMLAIAGTSCFAQDKLANLAPIDKRMRAIDSISIMRILEKESLSELATNLYPDWNNNYTTSYGVNMPKAYKIDLRGFHMPCDNNRVTSSYGYRRSFRRQHFGTDLKVYVGDTIRAAFSGKVRVVAFNRKGYGKYVMLRHDNGLETLYGHMSKQLVAENQEVKAGDPIGLGGNTGRSTGSHLHFETRFLGKFIDAEKLFDFVARDVKSDYYLFSSMGRGRLLTSDEAKMMPGNDVLAAEGIAMTDAEREEESRLYQEERRKAIRSQVHKVVAGENLSSIAAKHKTTVKALCRLNNIKENSVLRIGQILRCS